MHGRDAPYLAVSPGTPPPAPRAACGTWRQVRTYRSYRPVGMHCSTAYRDPPSISTYLPRVPPAIITAGPSIGAGQVNIEATAVWYILSLGTLVMTKEPTIQPQSFFYTIYVPEYHVHELSTSLKHTIEALEICNLQDTALHEGVRGNQSRLERREENMLNSPPNVLPSGDDFRA